MSRWSVVVCVAAAGCAGGEEEAVCEVVPGATWDAPDFDANAADALAVRGRLDALTATHMREAENGTATTDVATLEGLYTSGDPSIADLTAATWEPIVTDAFADFVDVIGAGPQNIVDGSGVFAPGEHGGLFGTDRRGIDEGGVEVRQILDKGLFGGGALYPHALTLTEGDVTQADVEAIAALWGADATFDLETRTDSSNYAYGMGYHGKIAGHLVAAHAYAADPACEAERDAELVSAFRAWEEALFARFVYYAGAVAPLFSAPGSDDDLADALHDLTEGLGLGLGFHGVAHPAEGPLAGAGRVTTDADVEAMMDLFGVVPGDLGASTTGAFVSDPTGYEAAVDDLDAAVGEVFGLSAEAVADFHAPSEG